MALFSCTEEKTEGCRGMSKLISSLTHRERQEGQSSWMQRMKGEMGKLEERPLPEEKFLAY